MIARLLIVAALGIGTVAAQVPDWRVLDYGALVDGRELSHSGDSVETLLGRLGGRPLPAGGGRGGDALTHALLDPLLEPYAFVLSDAVDATVDGPIEPWVEIGSLWLPGEPQPAWVELLRARRYVVESDGAGRIRAFLPADNGPGLEAGRGAPRGSSADEAEAAWRAAWPVLRHVLAAERARLAGDGEPPALDVVVRVYRHAPERLQFALGSTPYTTRVEATDPDGRRPPLDVAALERFLASGLQLEGARLEDDGRLRLFGSRPESPPTLLGTPPTMADLAVAYRAIFHGGLAEPYMSLDRGFAPQAAIVNYGGRLRDTRLGMVSLLCDIRFKTFSLGIGIREGEDLRRSVREVVAEFRTHLERFGTHPDSAGVGAQQTRLWFYPDTVDLTVAAQGDVLAMRRPRMAAASERIEEGGGAARTDPPWTLATVNAINRDYDELARVFPELADLDQVVRMLSLFTWLQQASAEGLPVPDLDVLLAYELPALWTPRSYPQLLTFTALPPAGATSGAVDVFDRVPFGEALERLNPTLRPGPARERLERAIAALDPSQEQAAAFLASIDGRDRSRLSPSEADGLAFAAERLAMHGTILQTPTDEVRETVVPRVRAGERVRVFSVAIGGLDLDMKAALTRAEGRRLGLGAAPAATTALPASLAARGTAREPSPAWKRDPAGLPAARVPEHGSATDPFGEYRRVVAPGEIESLYGASSPAPRRRALALGDDGRPTRFERFDVAGRVVYGWQPADGGGALRAVPAADDAVRADFVPAPDGLGAGLVALQIRDAPGSDRLPVRLQSSDPFGAPVEIAGTLPRVELRRLVLGRGADRAGDRPLGGFTDLPESLGAVETLMLLQAPHAAAPPWSAVAAHDFGEARADVLARSLGEWWEGDDAPYAAVVGTDAAASPGRWASAGPVRGDVPLVWLGRDATSTATGAALRDAWSAGPVVTATSTPGEDLTVIVSDLPPSVLARRVGALAANPRWAGRRLAIWSLAGPLRADLPARWLDAGRLAAVAIGGESLVSRRDAPRALAAWSAALADASADGRRRPENHAGPFLWFY